MSNNITLSNFINGKFEKSTSSKMLKINNPATSEFLSNVPISSSSEVNKTVSAAKNAFPNWRNTPAIERARYLFRLKTLLDENIENIAIVVTKEHGKTLVEARGSVKRGIENIEHACGITSLMMGESLEDVATGIDTQTIRQPLGVFAAIAPYNFPAMVPFWFWPYAIASGNTFILKPSEQVPLSQQIIFELIDKIKFPKGVINMIHGGKEVVEALIDNDDIAGISFVGSTPVAKLIYKKAASKGKRVQAFGGAKNYAIIMPDADAEKSINNIVDSAFGCAGQRCLAISQTIMVGEAYNKFAKNLIKKTSNLKLGNGLKSNVDLGPVISAKHKKRICYYIDKALKEGANLLLDGRKINLDLLPNGHFIGPTIFNNVTPEMTIAKQEIFGPVLSICSVNNLDEAINLVHKSKFGNTCSIFTSNGYYARKFKHEIGISMIGINVGVAAPMAFFAFGGTKESFFGDIKAHGSDSIKFFTDTKVVISRWF